MNAADDINPNVFHKNFEIYKHRLLVFLAINIVVIVLHLIFLLMFLNEAISFGGMFFFNMLVVIVPGFFLYAFRNKFREVDLRFYGLLTLSCLFLGIVGSVGTLLTVLMYYIGRVRSKTFIEWYETIFPVEEKELSEALGERLKYGIERTQLTSNLIPYLDIIRLGNDAQKREVIAIIARNFRPEFAPALRQALNDPSNSVRVQAATAISKIENEFLRKSLKLDIRSKREKTNADLILELARHFDDYAFTGILDEERERKNRERALRAYKRYLELRPDDLSARNAIGRIYLRDKKFRDAYQWFETCISQGYVNREILSWYFESLFKCFEYAKLREMVDRYYHVFEARSDNADVVGVMDAVNLWKLSKV